MSEKTRLNLVSSDIWVRALYMFLFMLAYSITKVIIVFVALFQFFSVLIKGRANEPVLHFGKNLSIYIYEILEFQTFNSEIHPFPFSDWPDEARGGDVWLDDEPEDDTVMNADLEKTEHSSANVEGGDNESSTALSDESENKET